MKGKYLTFVILALLILIVLVALFSQKKQKAAIVTQPQVTAPGSGKFLNTTIYELSGSKESGTASLEEINGKVRVRINVQGEPLNASQPAHIHMGTCKKLGDIVYPLQNVVRGVSETMLPVTLNQIVAKLPLSLNVHASEKDITTYVACGELPQED